MATLFTPRRFISFYLGHDILDAPASYAPAEEARDLAEGAASQASSVGLDVDIGSSDVLLAQVIWYEGEDMIQGADGLWGRLYDLSLMTIGYACQPLRPVLNQCGHYILTLTADHRFGIQLTQDHLRAEAHRTSHVNIPSFSHKISDLWVEELKGGEEAE